jgi:TolB-like protein/Flp pilus assembly protein TadD
VLPFDNLSPDPDDAFLTDGIHDEIITRLGKISDLKVISRTSALVYRDSPENLRVIGRQLGADNILEGSVRREGDRIRITVQLIDARSDEHLWSDIYERDMSGIFAIQSEVAAQVAHAVGVSLPPSERARIEKRPTQSLQAYNDYLRGRYHWARLGRDDLRLAIDYFNRAIEEDPRFALAYVGLAEASMLLAELEHYPPAELARMTREPALRALEIDNSLADAHAILAFVLFTYDFDWLAADSTFRLALALNPNSSSSYLWYCQFLGAIGRTEEAIAACERGGELDPLDPFVSVNLAAAYLFYARQPEVAYTHLLDALELWPGHWVTHILLGFYYYFFVGQPDQGVAEFERTAELRGRDIGPLAFAYAREGREADAREILRQLQVRSAREYVPAFELAIVYAGLGERDKAFEMLETAYEERYHQMRSLPWNPVFDDLRTDQRFIALLEKMGLPN